MVPSLRSLATVTAVVLGLAAEAAAQRILVVDGLNRPGAQFTDLPAAEAAARNGDILDVRADGGIYTAITTSKALTILGNRARIRVTRGQPFRVAGLPAGRRFVLQRCTIFLNQLPPAPSIEIVQCAGHVHLDEVEASNYTGGATVDIAACAGVTIHESRLLGGTPALRVRNATVSVSGWQVVGASASANAGLPAGPGIRAEGSSLELAGVQVRGGLGDGAGWPPAPALSLAGSSVSVAGGEQSGRLTAGPYGSAGGSVPVPAVAGQASLVRHDPSVPVRSTGGAPPFVGVTVVNAALPSLRISPRSHRMVSFQGPPAVANATLAGLPSAPTYIPNVGGALWLAPQPIVALAGVPRAFPWRFPKGVSVGVQVASLAAGALDLSNPVVLTMR